jgi:hypothetical protein
MLLSANLKGATSRGNVRKILYVISSSPSPSTAGSSRRRRTTLVWERDMGWGADRNMIAEGRHLDGGFFADGLSACLVTADLRTRS